MVQKSSIAVLFAGLGTVGVLLLTNHTGLATKVTNYLYFLVSLGVVARLVTYEKK